MPARPSIGALLFTYLALLLLLAATVFAAALPIGAFGLLIALAIAAIKTLLVVMLFMHVKFESRAVSIFAGTGVLWLSILFALTFSDYLARPWFSRTEALPPHITSDIPQSKDMLERGHPSP